MRCFHKTKNCLQKIPARPSAMLFHAHRPIARVTTTTKKKHENICNQSTKMRILLLFFSFSLALCVCLGLCVIVNLSSCSSEIEPKMIFREHHLIIEGSFAFEVHDRFMSKDAFRRRPKTQPNRERARDTERASERVSEQDRKSPRVLLALANQMCVKWHSLTTPMTLI